MTNKIVKVMEQYVDYKYRKEQIQETQQGMFLQINTDTIEFQDDDLQTVKEIYNNQPEISNCIHILSFQKFYQFLISTQSSVINQIFSDILFGFMEGCYSEYYNTFVDEQEKSKQAQQVIKFNKRKMSMAERKGSAQIQPAQQRKGSLQIQTTQQKQQQIVNVNLQKGISKGIFKQCNLMKNVDQIVSDIFQEKQILQTKEFQDNIFKIHKKENNQVLFTIVELMKIEIQLTELDDFFDCVQEQINSNSEIDQMSPGKNNNNNLQQNNQNSDIKQDDNQPQNISPARCNSDSSTGMQNPNNNNTKQLQNNLNQQIQSQQQQQSSKKSDNKQNYYLKTIDKLMNKCIFNGEDNCDCKKCQCIRRNRNSAKESQKRKREALQQLGPLQEKYEKLEKKVLTLNEQNKVLKDIFKSILEFPDLQPQIKEVLSPKKTLLLEDIEENNMSQEEEIPEKNKDNSNIDSPQNNINNPTTHEDLPQNENYEIEEIKPDQQQQQSQQQEQTMGDILSRKQSEQQQQQQQQQQY